MTSMLTMEVLTPAALTTSGEAKQFLTLWLKELPELVPQRWGQTERYKEQFNPDDLNPVLNQWELSLLFKRSKPSMWASVAMRLPKPPPAHATFTMTLKQPHLVEALVRFMGCACVSLDADLGFVHVLTEEEIDSRRGDGSPGNLNRFGILNLDREGTKFSHYLVTRRLEKYLPDLYWTTVFGPAYTRLFGMDRLMAAPAPYVERIGPESVLIRLSDRLDDFCRNYEAVDSIRRAVKAHLDCNAFFDLSAPADHVYNVPTFVWKDPGPDSAQAVPKREFKLSFLHPKDSMKSKAIMATEPQTEALMQRGAREALDLAKNNGFHLDFSEASMEVVERLLAQLSSDFRETGSPDGFAGLAMILGAYIGEVIRRRGRGGVWNREKGIAGIESFQFLWQGLALPLPAWCAKRIFLGDAENVWLKYQALVASRTEPGRSA